jgi:hypothetical protein
MGELAWDAVRDEFAFDGSWRDIYVLGTDMAGWQRMLDGLRAAGYDLAYFRDHQPNELPVEAAQAFPLPDECDRLLLVRFAEVQANCHFFWVEDIEFDIDPREVVGQEQLDAVFGFMRCLSQAVGKDAILTAENCPKIVIFRVRPEHSAVEHQAFGGWHDWRWAPMRNSASPGLCSTAPLNPQHEQSRANPAKSLPFADPPQPLPRR